MKAEIISMLPHLIAGLLGGVLASIIVVVFALWWQKGFVPWVENRLYKGPRIEGIWQSEIIRSDATFSEHTVLKQFGYRVTGEQVYSKDRYGRSHTYSLEGEFRERTLALIFHETGPSRVDSGAFVLDYKTIGPAITLEGHGIWRDQEGKLVVENYKWTKQEERKTEPETPAKPKA